MAIIKPDRATPTGRQKRRTNLLLIVARAPLPGLTKTRLAKTIGNEQAALLHQSFLKDLARRFIVPGRGASTYSAGWAHTPPEIDFRRIIRTLAPESFADDLHFISQRGETLGQRLTSLASASVALGFEKTILMASDSPQLPHCIAGDAFEFLDNYDLVIGRVLDGGYYLVGMNGFSDILSHVPMSTTDAAGALVQIAQTNGLTVGELEESFDVDVVEDLELLIRHLAPDGVAAPATWDALQKLGLVQAQKLLAS